MKKTLFAVLIAVTIMLSACGTQTATTPKTPTPTSHSTIEVGVVNETSCSYPAAITAKVVEGGFILNLPKPQCGELPTLLSPTALTPAKKYHDAFYQIPWGERTELNERPTKILITWERWKLSPTRDSLTYHENNIVIKKGEFTFSASSAKKAEDIKELYLWLAGRKYGEENFPKEIKTGRIYILPLPPILENNPLPNP